MYPLTALIVATEVHPCHWTYWSICETCDFWAVEAGMKMGPRR